MAAPFVVSRSVGRGYFPFGKNTTLSSPPQGRGLFFFCICSFLLRPHAGRASTFCYAAESKPPKNKHNERGARIQGDCAPLAIPRRRRFAEPIPAFKDRAAPPGFRDAFGDRGYGGLGYVGARGSSWSSTAFGSSIRFFELGPDWLTPQHSSLRAYGFQLRCLQE